ncbi:OmpA family protein [Rheinheimera sp. NSM]|uniref:OmpA family protein n=1 Tax=Rheinheimera sp. NSM TaxID=3457884 RepID=UPI0040363860
MRTLSLSIAVVAALLSTGCVSTSGNSSAADPAAVNAGAAKAQTLFTARLQPAAGVVTSTPAEHQVKVSFPGITAFSHDGARLSDELQRQLTAVAESLKGIDYQQVTVLGHTDSSGQLTYNNKLSQQRAEQVMTFLQQQGLTTAQLAAEGRGPAEPIADNSTAQGRAANRRVELLISFDAETVAGVKHTVSTD